MEKYNKKIVYDYIYGNDIENYTLEELSLNQNYIVSFHPLEEQSNSKVNKKFIIDKI